VSERFRALLPEPADGLEAADLAAAIPGPPPGDRPFLAVNFIATADGRATIRGHTGPIANRADHELFHALRTRVDAVMVGAQTVRVEGYGRMDPIAILVSRSLDVPADVGLLRAPENRVVVLTPSPTAELPACAASVAYLRETDLARAMRRLRAAHGVDSVLCEGGAQLLANLLAAGVVDELHLVIAAKLAGGPDPLTILTGPALDPPIDLTLLTLHESGGYLFVRYGVELALDACQLVGGPDGL
jgi:riboflavin biosynthesis pyrimidine reductase